MAPKTRVDADFGMAEVIRGLIEAQALMMSNQNAQAETIRQGLQFTVAAIEHLASSHLKKDGTAEDFRKMGPVSFSGTEGPLVAEEWLDEVEDLLVAARVPAVSHVEVAKLQLKDVARVWWKVEEERLEKPVPWFVFRELYFDKFFPETSKADLLQQFL